METQESHSGARAAAVLKCAAPRRTKKNGQSRARLAEGGVFLIDAASDDEKRLYAAAVVFHGNNTAAFRDAFGEAAVGKSSQLLCYYARQLNEDPVVRDEVARILDARTDGKLAGAADKRRAAIEAVAKLNNIMRADHEEAVAAVIGKPVSEIETLPPHLRGVIEAWGVKIDAEGNALVDKVKLRCPLKAAETMARWTELAKQREGSGYTAESAGVAVFDEGAGGRRIVGASGRSVPSGETATTADIG